MTSNRRLLMMSLVLHLVGVTGMLVLSKISPPVVSLTPQRVDVHFQSPVPEPPRMESNSGPVSRETPEVRSTPRETPKPKPTPKKTAKPTPKPTPKKEATPKPESTPKPKPKPKPKPEPTPKETESGPPTPIVTMTYPTPTRPPSSSSNSSKSSSSNSSPPSNSSSSSNPKGNVRADGSQQGAPLGVLGGLSLPAYYSKLVVSTISTNFKVPEDQRAAMTCRIGFYIYADGRIAAPKILESSGDLRLDSLALEALKRTERVAPLPDELQSKVRSIEAHLTFSFDL